MSIVSRRKSYPASNDCVLEWMKRKGIAMTRENYLCIAYMGHPPADEELDAEMEALVPREFQVKRSGRTDR